MPYPQPGRPSPVTLTEQAEAWKDHARCAGEGMNKFFPEERNKVGSKAYEAEVQSLREEFCWACPVRVRCFEYALESEHSRGYGVQAGTTPQERLSFIQVRCRCGRTLDPFDLVKGLTFRCASCRLGA